LNLEKWKNFSHDWYIYFFARINNYKVFIDTNSFIQYRIHQTNVHGQLNLNNLNSIKKRVELIKSGWYFEQIANFRQLIPLNSEFSFIYDMYYKNIFTRSYILFLYNFKLMRSRVKFVKFFFLSTIIKSNKKK
jgi:rhamnosyltransferase